MPDNLPFPPGSRLVAYLRDSGGRDQDLSVTQQEKALGEWCKAHHYVLSRIFKDTARSGTRVRGREQFLEMVEYLDKKAPEQGVIFWDFSRTARDYDDFSYYISDFRRLGYICYSLNDNIPQGLDGRLLESITAWKNAKFIEDLSRHVRRGLRFIVEVHHAYMGLMPFGYKGVPKKIGERREKDSEGKSLPHEITNLVPDPETAPLARRAFEMRAAGATYREIDQELHLYKQISTYGHLLSDKIYIGIWVYSGQEFENFCEPLISRELWAKVQQINAERRFGHGYNHPRVVRSPYLLSSLVSCGACGAKAAGIKSYSRIMDKHYFYYVCEARLNNPGACQARRIPKETLEAAVISAVLDRILKEDVLQDLYDDWAEWRSTQKDQISQKEKANDRELASLRRRIHHLVTAIEATGHSSAMIKELAELEEKESELKQQIFELETHQPAGTDLPDLPDLVGALQEAVLQADESHKAMILRGFIKGISVEWLDKKLRGKIEFYLPMMGDGKSKFVDL